MKYTGLRLFPTIMFYLDITSYIFNCYKNLTIAVGLAELKNKLN